MAKNPKPQPDAPESSAGDDFHLLWAARRALKLLQPQSELVGVRPEGPAPEEAGELDPSGGRLLGIDLAEYYGGECFEDASEVVHLQLKYSTRRSNEAWKPARLARGKKGKHSGSVIHRLAQVFKAYLDKYGREAVLAKLRIRLVSNRPCDPALADALAAARRAFDANPQVIRTVDLFRRLGSVDSGPLRLLSAGSIDLDPGEFTDFLRVLDLSHCGEPSRLDQDIALVREIGKLGFGEVSRQYAELKNLLWRRMMPESRNEGVLTGDDIAPVFGIPSIEHLFPSPSRFEELEEPVERQQVTEIARTIVDTSGAPICIHGGAGIGKTTLVRSLLKHLPRRSVLVIFDCYGGGSYLDRSEGRHGYSRAVMQIGNELATQTGSALLLHRDQPPEELLRALGRRLASASSIVRGQSADALVVIIVDAAGHSVLAGEAWQEDSFVRGLASCALPTGCRLVITARSHRIRDLRLPPNAVHCEVLPFNLEESRANVRRYIGDAPESQIAEFHRLSNGIPRFQAIALSHSDSDLDKALAVLRPEGKTLENLIDDQLLEAGRRMGKKDSCAAVCSAFLALPRPVPLKYAALLSGEDERAIADFCVDMFPHLSLERDAISFRNEDFESRLRQQFDPDSSVFEKLANVFTERSASDGYAAANLAEVLKRAGRHEEIVELIHREKQPAAVTDPIERKEVFARRARLALEVALERGDRAKLLRLLFVVAEAAKIDQAVEDLLLENADIACRYADPATIHRLYLNESNRRVDWYGPTHLLCAANYSRNKETHARARKHLRAAMAWLRHWSCLPDEERQRLALRIDDIALGAEALLRLDGCREAVRWLSGWRPRSVIFSAAQKLAQNVISADGSNAFELLGDITLRADGILAAVGAAMEAGLRPPRKLVLRAVSVWHRFASVMGKRASEIVRPGILLCEAAALHQLELREASSLINFFLPPAPEHRGSIYLDDTRHTHDNFLRARSLLSTVEGQQLAADDASLLPARLHEEPEGEDSSAKREREEERKGFKELYDFLLPAYLLRAEILVGRATDANFQEQLESVMNAGGWRWSAGRRHDEPGTTKLKALILTDAVIRSCRAPKEAFRSICGRYCKDGWLDLALVLAEKAVSAPALHDEVLKLVDDKAKCVEHDPLAGREQVNTLVRCSRIAGAVDSELGRHYFDLAVEAAGEIDEEAFGLLQLLSALAKRAATDDPAIDKSNLAADLATIVEDCHWRLEGLDHFPWTECVEGITSLSAAVAAATLGRWNQRGIMNFSNEIPSLVRTSLSQRAISPAAAIAWGVLSSLGSEVAMAVSLAGVAALQAGERPSAKLKDEAISILSDHAIRLAPLRDRGQLSKQVMAWAEAHSAGSHTALRPLKELVEFLDSIQDSDRANEFPTHQATPAYSSEEGEKEKYLKVDWDRLLRGRSFCEPEEVESVLQELDTLINESDPPWSQRSILLKELLSKIKTSASPRHYRDQLDALVAAEPDLLRFDDLADALRDRLASWAYHRSVKKWQEELPQILADRRFDTFFWSGHFAQDRVDMVERELGISHCHMIEAFMRALPEHVRDLSATSVYELTTRLVTSLPAGAALKLLEWAIPELKSRIKTEGLACQAIDVSKLPNAGVELEAAVLWFLFGHPDKRVRWRAVHAARRMIRLGESEIVTGLSRWLDAGRDHPFVMPSTTFYWLAARQWFFVLVDRLSAEMPETVLPISDVIAKEAVAPETPHALVMRLAKRAALRLAEHAEKPYSPQEIRAIVCSLTPAKEQDKQDTDDERVLYDDYRRASAKRFHFRSTDTLPYWYNPVCLLFNVNGDEFCRKAERWICDEWGFEGTIWESDPVQRWQISDREWALTSNRHGSEPTIEDLHTYLEFNAMFCVAAELCSSRPVVEDGWEKDPWENWLSRWDLAWCDRWVPDWRQTTPLEPHFWIWSKHYGDDWASAPGDPDCDRAVGLLDPLYTGCVVAHARLMRYEYDNYESIDLTSALVSEETSQALLYALAQCENPFDYRIPPEGDELEFDEALADRTRFILKGWLKTLSSDTGGLDQHDPLRYGLGTTLVVPGTMMTQRLDLILDDARWRSHRRARPSTPVTIYEHWNDCPDGQHHSALQTQGHRLWVRLDDLVEFLKSGNWALIVECIITRHVRRYERSSEEKEHDQKARLYLIHSDGTVETTEGCSRLGETAR